MKSKVRQTLTTDWENIVIEKQKPVFRKSRSVQLLDGFTPELFEFHRPLQHFVTGSSYEGSWNSLGFSGYGIYYFPHGAIYQGYFKDGQFHGKGEITYPVGHMLKGYWKYGKRIHQKFIFDDGLEVSHPWKYCQMPDRRFQSEFNTTLKGPGQEFLTNKQPTIEIPEKCYDTIDGIYDPAVKCIFQYEQEDLATKGEKAKGREKSGTLKRTVQLEESKFIESNFRRGSVGSQGYRPDLYEYWMAGRAKEVLKAMSEIGLNSVAVTDTSGTMLTRGSSSDLDINMEVQFLFS